MSALPGRLVLLGHPASHSLSPAFQNAALRAAGIPLTYEALDVQPADLARMIGELRADAGAGNVTIPHKRAVAETCDDLTAEARRTGAVNTFAMRDGRLVGHNTDVFGFDRAARELIGSPRASITVGIIGAGGAAAAVLAAVESWGARAMVANRNPERAAALVERFRSTARVGDAGELADAADLVVNATSLGLAADDALPIDPVRLRKSAVVLDLVYARGETRFVRAARARGLSARDGLSMLVAQGAAAFEWWFGVRPDVEVMWRATGRGAQPAG